MKLLFVMDHHNPNNGVTVSALRYAEALIRRGHQVRFLGTGVTGQEDWELPQFHLPIFDKLITSQGMIFAKSDKRIITQAVEWADCVHFLVPFTMSVRTAVIAKKLGKPMTAAFHVQPQNISYSIGMGRFSPVNTFIYWYFRVTFFRRFRHIHCPSAFIAGQLEKHHYKAQLHVISNGVDPKFTYQKLPKPAQWQDKFVILMIGRLSREKRQDVLIEAVNRSKYREKIQLELAGQGPREEAVRRQGQCLPNPPGISFYTQDELRALIAQCDLYVHAADAEIEAMSCMEAFSSGLVPIIADSRQSATPQFALDEHSLFKAGDADDLAAKIDWWIEHPEFRAEMEKAYSISGEKYALDACVGQFEAMLAQEAGLTPEPTA